MARTAAGRNPGGGHRRRDDPIPDAMGAATAVVDGPTVVTRTVRDRRELGVATLDPFEARPG